MPLDTKQRLLNSIRGGLLVLGAATVGLTGCAPSRIADDSPRSSVYPDFSKPLTSAMPQLSDEDAAKQSAHLSALAARRRAGTISEAEYLRKVQEMRALAAATAQQ
jgi:hypothetical protein